MFCNVCGNENPPEGKFCWNCGEPAQRSTVTSLPVATVPAGKGCYAEGSILVIPNGTPLPRLCVQCGKPARHTKLLKYSWLNPVYYLFLFLGLGILLIMAIFSKRINLAIPLCEGHLTLYKARKKMTIIWLLVAALAFGIGIAYIESDYDWLAWLVMSVAFITGLVYASRVNPLRASMIDKQTAKLRGASPSFLGTLGARTS